MWRSGFECDGSTAVDFYSFDFKAPGMLTSTPEGCVGDSATLNSVLESTISFPGLDLSFTSSLEQCFQLGTISGMNLVAIQGNVCKGFAFNKDIKQHAEAMDEIKKASGTCDKKCDFDQN